MPETAVKTSVIVPCYNAAAHLGNLLESLVQQDAVDPWEVIVVDNASSDNSSEVARAYASRLPGLRIVRLDPNRGPSGARNAGVRAATGDHLIFIDSDDEVNSSYVRDLSSALDHDPVVFSRVDYAKLNDPWILETFRKELDGGLSHGVCPFAFGGTLGIRRQVRDEIGDYDEHLMAQEDIDYCWRLFRAGYQMRLVESAIMHYQLIPDVSAIYWKCYRDSLPSGLVMQKNFPGYVPLRLSLVGLVARFALLVAGVFGLWKIGARGRWFASLGYLRGDFEGALKSGYLCVFPAGEKPEGTEAFIVQSAAKTARNRSFQKSRRVSDGILALGWTLFPSMLNREMMLEPSNELTNVLQTLVSLGAVL